MQETDLEARWYKIQGVNPEPWEAAEGSVGRKGGKMYVQFHSTAQMRAYQESIKGSFKLQNPDARMHEGRLDVHFFFWRQIAVIEAYEGRKPRAHIADVTNLQKSLEDALQGMLYKNDKNNLRVCSEIIEQSENTTSFILVRITRYRPDPVPVLMRSDLEEENPTSEGNFRPIPDGIF